MKMLWQTETTGLACRWFNGLERTKYNPPWIQNAPANISGKNVSAPPLDYTRFSPFGNSPFSRSEWHVSDRGPC